MSIEKAQKLVNAQVSVNRAVFLMNAQDEPDIKAQCDTSDAAIALHIKQAIEDLHNAYSEYSGQQQLF